MPRLIISTVGTSLLTNQIDSDLDPNDWYERLLKTANYTTDEVDNHNQDIRDIIEELKQRAENVLADTDDVDAIREASAELNGIYGIYDKNLQQAVEDCHILITTDTKQGRVASELVETFLKRQGIVNVSSYYPEKFSVASSNNFLKGMAELISFIQSVIKNSQKEKYHICFNLVGGFKAFQGYLNTIGMFYADEIVYIFEGSNQIISVPRLPVEVDVSVIEPYKVPLAMMSAELIPANLEITNNIPPLWVWSGKEITLSIWGQLLWDQCKDKLLCQQLLKFPKIEYLDSFIDDYNSKPAHEKIIVQEQLARVACLLNSYKDGITVLKQDGIFRLRRYEGKYKDIDHFDLPKDRRISCTTQGNTLILRHYGEHDYVNKKP